MALPALLTALLPGITSLISKAVPDKDKAADINAAITMQILSGQSAELQGAIDIILAEAKGESWLQRNWRPLMMLWFGALLGLYWFGILPPNLTQGTLDNLFNLLQLGIGGYIGGRTVEKTIPMITEAIVAAKGKGGN